MQLEEAQQAAVGLKMETSILDKRNASQMRKRKERTEISRKKLSLGTLEISFKNIRRKGW